MHDETTCDEPAGGAPVNAAKAGFTLTELMVTLFIIGLLSVVVAVNVLPLLNQASSDKARVDISQLDAAVEQFRLDMLRYPTTEEGLEALVSLPDNADRADRYRPGGYIKKLPQDPWGNAYQYLEPGEDGRPFDIFSFGRDGRPGGEDDDADIGNWQ